MTVKCPKCSYERLPTDTAPDYECPSCGVIYAKYNIAQNKRREEEARRQKKAKPEPAIAKKSTAKAPQAAGGLKFCADCGEKMPGDARFCQKCGAKQEVVPQISDEVKPDLVTQAVAGVINPEKLGKMFYIPVILIAVGFVIWMAKEEARPPTPEEVRAMKLSNAFYACRGAVKNRLKSPSSASFNYEPTSADEVDGGYHISSWVDAQNSFGATLRQYWSCTYKDGKVVNILM